ncbi:MAG: ABC transporter permease [Candidatus Aminicenantes bacterium]|nr:MAG: ABC transporter permease [Candidatus Aminicenantes bacterium]
MFKNYFLTTFRNIRRHKMFSLINVVGLATGITCCILVFLWIQNEMSYDRFHEKSDELYRVISKSHTGTQLIHQARTPNALAETLKEEYHEIINATRFRGGRGGWLLKYGDKIFKNDRLGTADPSFFEMFSFPFIKGDPKTALKDRYSIVITESMAKKYFGDVEPMGKVITLMGPRKDMKVTGVIRDVPRNSHIQFDYVFPLINMREWWREDLNSWERYRFHTYIEVNKNVSADDLSEKISGIIKRHFPGTNTAVYLQSLKDIHLRSDFKWDQDNFEAGSIIYVYVLSLTALCILLVACINFMNLATARSANRAKEVGIRKIVGAQRRHIIKQFFGESIVLSFIALCVAIILVYIFLPVFNTLSGKQLKMGLFAGDIQVIIGIVVITLFTGIMAGSYPALLLSAMQPINVLKKIGSMGKPRGELLRKLLVVLQFIFIIILIIGTTVIYSQLDHIKNRDLGFDEDHVVHFSGQGEFRRNIDAVKHELLQNPNIVSVAKAYPPISTLQGTTDVNWEGKNPDVELMVHPGLVDYDYLKTFNMKMVQGRFFSKEFPTDTSNFVLNETAVKVMGIESPVGKRFSYRSSITNGEIKGIIIGVIKDFHQSSLHNEIEPLVLRLYNRPMIINIKIRPEKVSKTISFIESKWKKFAPDYPFSYEFLDERIDSFYDAEGRIGSIFKYSTFLAMFIACLGLLGLLSFMVEQKTKEIGIRKVLGASEFSIVLFFLKSILKWVIAAIIIACPAAWYLMSLWLQNFSYRISISWLIFLFAGGVSLLLSLLTVSYQTIKAARTNPVDSLRYE